MFQIKIITGIRLEYFMKSISRLQYCQTKYPLTTQENKGEKKLIKNTFPCGICMLDFLYSHCICCED